MSKKAQIMGLEFDKLIMLIISAVLAVATFSALYTGVLRLSARGTESYDKFASTLETLKEAEVRSLPLYVDKETAIIAFDQGKNSFKFQSEDNAEIDPKKLRDWTFLAMLEYVQLAIPKWRWVKAADLALDLNILSTDIEFFPEVKKPEACKGTATCMCLCREFEVTDLEPTYEYGRYAPQLSCIKPHNCKTFEGIKSIYLHKKKFDTEFPVQDVGAIFPRELFLAGEQPRLQEVYLEKRGPFLYACDYYPCAPQSIQTRASVI
ncbi:hypothetical protein KY328_01140 [Candidatus Woesearchaeota archaeon]|nr:hypothetical protein [Candidatus Woesearchaeota archaeon]MBW3021502.1 hypothetical protein [Candidatus Woesearchaeota archaeon]